MMEDDISNFEDSVKKVREIRKKLSKEKFNLDELNNFGGLSPFIIDYNDNN